MIFVTVGTQLPFDRLVRTVDAWAGRNGRQDVFAQIGPSDITPRHVSARRFLSPREFADHFSAADLVVAHAGMGSIISAMTESKPLLVMPRLARFGEHRNDHQMSTARRFREMGHVAVAMDEKELEFALNHIDQIAAASPTGTHASKALIEAIRSFIATTSQERR